MDPIYILSIETATPNCSIALSKDGEMICSLDSEQENAHSAKLTLLIDEALKSVKIDYSQLSAVAVSMGPGSYTGLRIGVSTAKGLCYALDIPLISANTLEAMACGIEIKSDSSKTLLCPMLDARRMEVYCALYDSGKKEFKPTEAKIIDDTSFFELLNDHQITFFGSGAEKCKTILSKSENAIFIDDYKTSAKYVDMIAFKKFQSKDFEDVAYFEPFYLKDFVATTPKNKILGN